MNYVVKPLSPELSGKFTDYLENLDFNHSPHWASCFCRFYHTNCSFEEWQGRSGLENKLEAIDEIEKGNMKGYLAFDEDKCIGWCNANDAGKYVRLKEYLKDIISDKKVGLVICFVIHQAYRNQGVARLILRKIIEDFTNQSYDAVLALPVENNNEPEKLYRGTLNMYKEFGFKEIGKDENTSIMWLEL